MKGYIKLHRKLLENPIHGNMKYAWLWIVLLLLASHKGTEFLHGNKLIKLECGQLLTGRKQLAEKSGIKEGTIETILNYLESQQQIQQQKTTKYRVITILNWDKYQQDQQQIQQQNNNKITTKRQQNDTFKNVKNVKNVKKENIYIQNFEEFWKLHPKKIAKKDCKKKYLKILDKHEKLIKKNKPSSNSHENIMRGFKLYLIQWKNTDVQFIPNPLTWLNQERWNDEIAKKAVSLF